MTRIGLILFNLKLTLSQQGMIVALSQTHLLPTSVHLSNTNLHLQLPHSFKLILPPYSIKQCLDICTSFACLLPFPMCKKFLNNLLEPFLWEPWGIRLNQPFALSQPIQRAFIPQHLSKKEPLSSKRS